MPAGLQEILALLIVLVIVGFALYRRSRGKRTTGSCADGCAAADKRGGDEETTIHFYRRSDD